MVQLIEVHKFPGEALGQLPEIFESGPSRALVAIDHAVVRTIQVHRPTIGPNMSEIFPLKCDPSSS